MHVVELDEVQYDLEVDGELVRKQLGRRIWERGGWATVAIAFVERDGEGWKPPKVALLRFRRMHEVWQRQAAMTIALAEAGELADAIASWKSIETAPAK
jgi:hypothetical protein